MKPEPLLYVALTEHHRPSGLTRHTVVVNGKRSVAPRPAALRISRWDGEVILQYLDRSGAAQTHLHRPTVGEAIEQAEFEFGVQLAEWQRIGES